MLHLTVALAGSFCSAKPLAMEAYDIVSVCLIAILSLFSGWGSLMINPPNEDFRAGRICFWMSALVWWGTILMWGTLTNQSFAVRALIVGSMGAVGSIALMQGLRVVSLREDAAKHSTGVSPTAVASALKTPNFHLLMMGGNIFTPDAAPNLTGVALDAKIWNTGTPSVAASWSLEVVPESGVPVITQFTKIPPNLDLNGESGKVVIHGTDALDQKSGQQNISEIPIEGTLLFYCSLPKATILKPSTKLVLTVQDIYGHTFNAVQKMGDWMSL